MIIKHAVKLFLDKHLKQFLIICLSGAKHACNLKKDISNTYSNIQ